MKYEPQTSYASKIDEDKRFATAEEAAEYDRGAAILACQNSSTISYNEVLNGADLDLRRAILYLADLIREGEVECAKKAEPVIGELKELVRCDCSVADVCPQGKRGSEYRCQIWRTTAKLAPEPATMEEVFGPTPTRPEPTQEDFFKAYEAELGRRGWAKVSASKIAHDTRFLIRDGRIVGMTPALCLAWRAIGLDGEPTAEQIRALKETRG